MLNVISVIIGIVGTLFGIITTIKGFKDKSNFEEKKKDEKFNAICIDLEYIKSSIDENTENLDKITDSIVESNIKIARIDERLNEATKRIDKLEREKV
ncbi:MAG: hypothetical protein RR700_06220 [Anaerorhabdus sp.]|uniref:hypothetical protein n=1 Tax=Anaerorhabdus sp. TaxID=1872524 RepID=UPI002FC9A523